MQILFQEIELGDHDPFCLSFDIFEAGANRCNLFPAESTNKQEDTLQLPDRRVLQAY